MGVKIMLSILVIGVYDILKKCINIYLCCGEKVFFYFIDLLF